MKTPANLKDVAARAGVSISTASRALAGKASISAATRRRVEKVAAELNYQPNVQARGLRSSRTNLIGLAIPSLNNPFFATMAATIQECATANGQTTLITTSDENPEQLVAAIQTLTQMRVDGMIIVPSEGAVDSLSSSIASGTPIVLIDRSLSSLSIPTFMSDPVPGITAALEELCAKGHEHIGYLSGPQETSTGAGRLTAFLKACQEFHVAADHIYRGGFVVDQGRDGAKELLNQGVTALIAGDSMMTFGALDYCYSVGIKVGHDLAFVGFDDLVYMKLQPVPISVIDQNVEAMSKAAYGGLATLLNGGQLTTMNNLLDTTFIPRASTSCAPTTHTRR